ncbi:hypothetical protein PLEOSDRAFT_175420 [Pleurotus ostreatus PC15]|uniref:DUF6699 domain-containing protein n=1 Tax=Pleurotus ostreatus (strain PC15) TaxID=1137138 RepID=A0A067NY06_PLEO1|nr:hypothetical protein PLEOSDRAFT_175420 [Pleurotus ostreatus PC15]
MFDSLRGADGDHPERWVSGTQHPALPPCPTRWKEPNPQDPLPFPWECQLNPFLEHQLFGPMSLWFDIREDPSMLCYGTVDTMIPLSPADRIQPATHPFLTHMFINAIGDDPIQPFLWPFMVRNPKGIKCEDVYNAVYENFQEYVSQSEYDDWPQVRQVQCTQAYGARHSSRGNRESGFVEGIRRVDYLGDNIMFRGLEPNPNIDGFASFRLHRVHGSFDDSARHDQIALFFRPRVEHTTSNRDGTFGSIGYALSRWYIGLRGMLMWPEDVREDVAEFLLYLAEQDLDHAGAALQSAIFAVLHRPVAELGSNPHLKVTGLLILYARILENNDKGAFAYKVYNTAWEYLSEMRKRAPLTEPELIRMMAIAAKLGVLSDDAEVEMKWMSWAVDECRKWKQSRNDAGSDDGSDSVAALAAANREYYEDVRLSPDRPSTQLGFPRDHWNMDTIMFYHYFPQPQWDVESNPCIVFFLMGRIHERQKHPTQALSYYFEALDEPDPCAVQSGKELAVTETVAKVMRKHPIAFGHTKIIAQSITDCTTSILEDWVAAGGQDLSPGTTVEDTIEKLRYSVDVITSFAIVCFACTKSHDKQRVHKMMLLLKKLLDANRELVALFNSKVRKEIEEMQKAIKPVLKD